MKFEEDTFCFLIREENREIFDFNTLSDGFAAVLDIVLDIIMRMEKITNKTFDFHLPGIVLIDEVETHLHHCGMRIYKSAMRVQELNREMNILYDNLEEMKSNPDSRTAKRKLKAILRRESKFAAFKRGYIREYKEQYPQLIQYISDQD